jgi:hypothetical protein
MAMVLTPRSVGLMVAAAIASGWLGSSLMQDASPAQSAAPSGPRPIGSPAAVSRSENLRQRLSEPPLPSRGRNPFVYGSRAPSPSTGMRDRQAELADTPATPIAAPPPLPAFRLSGIASTAESGATVFTAIVIDNGSMVFAKAGDTLSNGYRVVRVDDTSITFIDAAGVTQTLKLP